MKSIVKFLSGAALLWLAVAAVAAEYLLEAEDALRHNWTDTQVFVRENGSGASNGQVLRLYTRELPDQAEVFTAEYEFTVAAPGTYRLWLSSTPQNAGWTSALSVQIDADAAHDLSGVAWSATSYADGFLGWLEAVTLPLEAGKHTLRLSVKDRRPGDGFFITYVDCLYLTTDLSFRPGGNYYVSALQQNWEEMIQKSGSAKAYCEQLNKAGFYRTVATRPLREGYSPEATREVLQKLAARPLPAVPATAAKSLHRFGVHGMEAPFLSVADPDQAEIERAFELLARAGVDSLRTAESCWHRLGDGGVDSFDCAELDYQIRLASRYGMNFCFTIGYPAAAYAMDGTLSAAKPEHEAELRRYLRAIIRRCAPYAQYFEYANEVDAPSVWWRNSTVRDYVRECAIAREELAAAGCEVPLLGISATYARDASRDGEGAGQEFCRQAVQAGIGDWVDGYSLHYTWPLNQRQFVTFFRNLAPGQEANLLVNSEECGYGHPGDIVKIFARDLYLYGFESVYYYLGQDWIEAGNIIPGGLFDVDWNPKLRLLAMAAAADAMKTRDLVAMAEPAPAVEAYLLTPDASGLHAVVLWQAGDNEEITPDFRRNPPVSPKTVKFQPGSVVRAVDWRLDAVAFDAENPRFAIGSEALIVYCRELPAWERMTAEAFLRQHGSNQASRALLPGE